MDMASSLKPYWILLILFPALLFGGTDQQLKPLKVLFIGNSYTALHTLPEIVAQMAQSKGKRLYYEMVAPGGRTFERHWNEGVAAETIESKRWDYVMFQNQSFEPVYAPENMMTYGVKLAEAVKAQGATPVYFMTWAYERERDFMKEDERFHGLFEGMQASLNTSYRALAEAVDGVLCPIGPAWERFRQENPDVALHNPDASHANQAGGYLSALMMYRVLFDEAVEDMPGTVYPYFREKSLNRWGDQLSIHSALRTKMEVLVNEVADNVE